MDAVNNIRRPALDDWALASGDILNASVCPSDKDMFDKIEISGKGTGLTIDFCNQDKPVWKVH